jgi:crotonobetainyl-CoA:carnitine CoA-transferase CaiB-like acyl-CoA transferase
MSPGYLPLAGVRVVEFSHMVMGPTCGMILADLGADVIKVEPVPEGDNTRRLIGAGAGFFATFNRNKKSLAIDLKTDEGMATVRKLIARADVVIENFRPGAMAKLGLDYASLKAAHPRLIYVSLKGFLKGPYDHRTALDEVVQMMGGLAYMTGPPGRPLRAGSSVNDIMGGMFGAIGALAAVNERHTSGLGREVTSALYENNVFLVAQHMLQYAVTGQPANPMPAKLPVWAIYDVFDSADGEQVFVAVVTDTQWRVFCDAFDLPDLAGDESLATNVQRVHARDRLIPMIADTCKRYGKADLMARFEACGLPYAPITKPHELFDDPHLIASGGLGDITLPDGRKTKVPMLPLEFDGKRLGVRRNVPRFAEHTRDVLAELGYDDAAVRSLLELGVVRTEKGI